jgi:hypothetical protein
MDPITLAILAGTAGTAVSQLPNIIPSRFERDQKKRMQDLQRKEELGLLGLSESERAALEGRMQGKANAAADYAKQERERLLSAQTGAGSSGQALLGAQVAEGQLRKTGSDIAQAIEEENLKKAAAQTDELRALEAAQGEYAAKRTAGLASIAGAGIEAGVTAAGQNALMQSAKTPSANSVSALAQLYGISEDQARGLIELSAVNPEALSLYKSLKK